ncbi:MAG TPA: cyclic nucleotide-binding domain-containing protein, partial [Mariprofundaceae bacterium]|nr:cyclic nucleotide-binding domain-containing protein [Mariprofundaceae bacterium]
ALAAKYPQIGRISASGGDETFLDMLPKDTFGKVWLLMNREKIDEGRPLFRQGEQGDSMYLLLDGELAVCMTGQNGKTVLLNLIRPGDVVGEGCLLDPGPRSADVVANKKSHVVKLPRKKILALMGENSGLLSALQRKSDLRNMCGLLSTHPLLQNVPLDMRQFMARETKTARYPAKQLIHKAGEELQAVDMLIDGKAAFMLRVQNTGKVIEYLQVGELVGDTSALRHATCPADVVALSDVLMAHIPYSAFKNVVEAYPPLKEKLLGHAEQQRTRFMKKVSEMSGDKR